MKKLIYILNISFLFFLNYSVSAQQTYVPDDNFEAYLEANFLGNGIANDDYVTTSAISSLTFINIISQNISDLTGIEDFTSLETLFAGSNNLTSIDVSANTALKDLRLLNNSSLNSLDVSSLTALEFLSISNTAITHLSLTDNTLLETFYGKNTPLVFLNLKNGNNTNISTLSLTGSSDLAYVNVDDESYSTTNWTSIESGTLFSENSYLNIPDDNFEMYLETHDADGNVVPIGDPTSLGNGIMDDYVNTPVIESLTSLDISNQNITDLTGIGAFAGLQTLDVSSNNLTSLDASANPNLINLNASENSITSINLNSLASLETLNVNATSLNSLDVSTNISLERLELNTSFINFLDLNNNAAITYLDVSGTPMADLDVYTLTSLETLDASDGAITHLDLTANTALKEFYGDNGVLEFLDLKNGTNTSITSIDITNNPNLTSVNVDDEAYSTANWTDVDPTTSFSEHVNETYVPDDNFEMYLETHDANGNVVSIGDVSSMGNGIANDDYVLTFRISAVTSLDISGEVDEDTEEVISPISDLTGIENFIALQSLICVDNSLTSLDVGNNINLEILDCSRNALTSLNLDSNLELQSLDCRWNSLSTLKVNLNTKLTNLLADKNSLANLDVSSNTSLVQLKIASNNLTSIDLTNNSQLESLIVYGNDLTELDLSNNTALTTVSVYNNVLTSLNIKNLTYGSLYLYASGNNFTCIEADTTDSSIFTAFSVDAGVSLGLSCNEVNVSAKVMLQGALTNPNEGEEHLMRDDLRIAGLIPTTSPYGDGATVSTSVFDVTGDNAIVDWIYVELRDKNDITSVLYETSALLQRDGGVVGLDGTSPLSFTASSDDYFICIAHRNHVNIVSNTAVSMSNTTTNVDLTNVNNIRGTANAVKEISGIYAMYAGDVDGNGNITTTDYFQAVGSSGVIDSYNVNDLELNGNVVTTDYFLFIGQSFGVLIQF